MDLGFGKENQVVGDAVGKALLASSQRQEAALDQELASYDALLQQDGDKDDSEADAALQQLRARRLNQLKLKHQQMKEWKAQGHGFYTELVDSKNVSTDIGRAFFDATKSSSRLVVHFYRPTTSYCDIFHKHLSTLAPKHLETKFVKLNVDGCENAGSTGGGCNNGASFLVTKLGIVVMPTLVLIKDRKVIHHMHGFDELGGEPNELTAETLAFVLSTHDMLEAHDNEVPTSASTSNTARSSRGVTTKYGRIKDGMHNDDYDSDE